MHPDWFVWCARRSGDDRFSRWFWLPKDEAMARGAGRRGAYMSVQAYPEQHERGQSKGKLHHAAAFFDFDAPTLAESCAGAFMAINHFEVNVCATTGAVPEKDLYHIQYSGNRSIH